MNDNNNNSATQINPAGQISIAPLHGITDCHCRYFFRLLTKHTLLYTEMIVSNSILHGDRKYLLAYNPAEHPIALQLAGSQPKDLALCAKIGMDMGYDEINFNIGCPSKKAQHGSFGACLMQNQDLIIECITAMQKTVSIPVSVKMRLGINNTFSYPKLHHLIATLTNCGCMKFIIHARTASLGGYSTKDNLKLPPLDHATVYKLQTDFPNTIIVINGNITSTQQITQHLSNVHGVMIGRAACRNPYLLAQFDNLFYKQNSTIPTREEIYERYLLYVKQQLKQNISKTRLLKPLLGLYYNTDKAKLWHKEITNF